MKQSPGSQLSQPLFRMSPVARFNIAFFTSWVGWWAFSDGIVHPAVNVLALGIVMVVIWKYHQ